MKKITSLLIVFALLLSCINLTAFAAEEIMITTDDKDLCTLTGKWAESTNANVKNPAGGTSWYTTSKDDYATFSAAKLASGSYGVYVYLPVWGTTAEKLDITVTTSGKSEVYTVNPAMAGAGNHYWEFVGIHSFEGKTGDAVKLQINKENKSGCQRAAAVKFVKDDTNPAKPGQTLTDKEDPEAELITIPEGGFQIIGTENSGFVMTDHWKESSLKMPTGKSYYTGSVGAYGKWMINVGKMDDLEVSVLKVKANDKEDPQAEYEVYAGGKTTTVVVDFTQEGNEFQSLGKFDFVGDGTEYIKFTKKHSGSTSRLTCIKLGNEEVVEEKYVSAFEGTDLHMLERMGMLIGEGSGITEDYLLTVPTRTQAAIMVLRLNGVDAEAAAFTGTDNFDDASQVSWAMPYLAYLKANPQYGLEGIGNNLFDPTAKINEQQYAKILLTALGYSIGTDFTWDETLTFAKNCGIASATSGAFNVKDLASATVSALNAKCKDGGSLLTKIVAKRSGVKDDSVIGAELTEELKAARTQAKFQKRFIYNNDGNDTYKPYDNYPGAFDTSNLDEKTINVENFLKTRSYGLDDSQVTTVFYCTGVFNSYHHTSTGITDTRVRDWSPRLKEFTGKDSLEIMTDYIHSLGKDIFWSMRMNDTHDYNYEEDELDPWKQAHMDLLITRKANAILDMPYGGTRWSSVDYTYDEVRQLVYDILKDTLTRYDVDGLELDFTRFLVYFKEVTQGKDIYPESIEKMTNLVRMVRDLTEKVSVERNKPILLAIYVPDSIAYSKALGMDIDTWLKEDLVDIVTIGCHSGRVQSWDKAFADYEGYDVPVYGAVDALGYTGEFDQNKEAALIWEAGAYGLYLYNYFNVNASIFDTLGTAETTGPVDPAYKTKLNTINSSWVKDTSKYMNIND